MTASPDATPQADQASAAASEQDEQVREMLRGYGLRSTSQRLAILHLLATADDHASSIGHHASGRVRVHLTATQLHDQLSESGNHLDITTVYRTLTTLVNLGVIHAIAHAPNLTTYGLAQAAHHHAVCTQCGAVAEIPAARLAATFDVVRDATGFRTDDSALTVHGLCRDCQAE